MKIFSQLTKRRKTDVTKLNVKTFLFSAFVWSQDCYDGKLFEQAATCPYHSY
jgi:hypothetical protein